MCRKLRLNRKCVIMLAVKLQGFRGIVKALQANG